MAFSGSVTAKFQGETFTLTLNGETGRFEAAIPTPPGTSWFEPGHVFRGTVEAVNTTASAVSGFDLRVLETTLPTVTVMEPRQRVFICNNCSPRFEVAVFDSESGLDPETLSVTLDGGIQKATLVGGVVYWDMPKVSGGAHEVIISIADYDGNVGRVVLELTALALVTDRTPADAGVR